MRLLIVWIINALALLALRYIMPSIKVTSFEAALVAALILSLVNTFIRPILVLLTLPVTMVTLGLFILVVNAVLFWFVGSILKGFEVDGFGAAFVGAIIYAVISWLLSTLVLGNKQI